ncbi:MAG TPA: phosphoenolpyruvate--protein phosphotransferase [Anaerolineae bacterium]|nr:phosphoenolpyruvate--protein phosphotransferase [Anaerolineae bacterium]
MVGLVIVSHSAKLAEGVAELARDAAGGRGDVPLAAAGGSGFPDKPFGTNANLVQQAIEQVYSDDGVLVLMDLGSAVPNAEMAVEALPPEQRRRIVLCEAPLIEGAIAAAVQASIGNTLEQVAAEARGALAPKAEQLGAAPAMRPPPTPPQQAEIGEPAELRLPIRNRLGLHARPAARFVQTAARFHAAIEVKNLTTGRGPVSAKSINAVATLGVRQGHEILLSAHGPDVEAALAAFQSLADANFGDEDGEPRAPEIKPPTKTEVLVSSFIPQLSSLQGLPASPGIAMGKARQFRPAMPVAPSHTVDDPQREWNALLAAIEKTRAQIAGMRESVNRRAGAYSAAIFEAHALYLDDEALREPARRAIFVDRLNAAAAWQRAAEHVAAEYRALDDEYQRARAGDVVDVGRQVVLNFLGEAVSAPVMSEVGILIAPDLTPADTARLDPRRVQGICTAFGGPTSHSAILARSLDIPAVVGLGERILEIAEGTLLIVVGMTGQVFPDPEASLVAHYAQRAGDARAAKAEARAASAAPAVTRDGRRLEVVANIGSPDEARAAVDAGAEGVGLFRTEFLFLDRQVAPDEEVQYAAYCAAAQGLEGRPLIIRTLDVGGDKPLPYLDLGAEANPFLGWRAIRLCLAKPDLFKAQLRAIVRAAADFPVKVMFPMVATLAEWRAARALLEEARLEVRNLGQAAPDRIETGIMVEIPSAALQATQFAEEVDFFSIGTNDLSQYTLAAERGNARVAALADGFQPAVLRLIQLVVEAAHARGKWVGVCGEMGGDPLAVPLLVGLGVDELSMNTPAIPKAKQIIRGLDSSEARKLAQAALELGSAEEVRRAMSDPP